MTKNSLLLSQHDTWKGYSKFKMVHVNDSNQLKLFQTVILTCAPLPRCFKTLSKHVDKVKSSPLCTVVQNRSHVFATSCLENGIDEGEGGTLPQMRKKAGSSS